MQISQTVTAMCMHQVQHNGRIICLLVLVGLLYSATTGSLIAAVVLGSILVAPIFAAVFEVVQERRRAARRVPRAIVSRRRR